MEMDFMGLHAKAKEGGAVVKEEVKDAVNDAAAANSNMFWGVLPHKTTALPQFMSFKSVPEDRSKNFTLDHHMSSVFHPAAGPDGFEKKPSFGYGQKNHSVAVPNANVNHLSRPIGGNGAPAMVGQLDIGSFTFPNHSVPMTIGGGSFYTVQSAVQGVKQHVLGGVPVTTSNFLAPVSGPHVGTYASRTNEKISDDSEQLTIFYRGAVNVFSNITPEKAQAIMFLAGTASPVTTAPTLVGAQAQAPIPSKPEPCSGLSSPISVTSNPRTQSGSGSSNPDELLTSKLASPLTLTSKLPGPVTQTITPSILLQNAVPQARKASLARFLEKRKERSINAGPYAINQQIGEMKNVRDDAGTSGQQLLSLGQENRVSPCSTLQTKLQL